MLFSLVFLLTFGHRAPRPLSSAFAQTRVREFTNNGQFVTRLDHHCIRREYRPVDSPKYDGVVKRRIAKVLDAAMASCLEAPRLFSGVPLRPTGPLWAEACVHASDAMQVSAGVRDGPDVLSPYQQLHG